MSEKVLGLDLGTNSIGWAIVEKTESGISLLDKGVNIFKDGVEYEKNIERPAVKTRTDARALRRHYFRRRLRKIEVLKVLIQYNLCPALTEDQLMIWRKEKKYPLVDEFMLWQRTDDNIDKNPYHDRYRALTESLNLELEKDRLALGRAFYHLAQRRGFLSNRKDTAKEQENGKVKQAISGLSRDMADAGCTYLGEYFYKLYQERKKIRKHYTSRVEHYRKEFDAICEKQNLPEDLRTALTRAIFFQRPLKSQKGLVGKCVFERNKARCPESHPRFEEFRMFQFINNIRIVTPYDTEYRPLNDEEIRLIRPLFYRKSKSQFDFEEIAKKIAKKSTYGDGKDGRMVAYRFNYHMSATVTGCPVTASLMDLFGEEWLDAICSQYILSGNKNPEQILNDVWHVLFSFDDDEKLKAWAIEKLQLSEEEAIKFTKIRIPQGYASLSLRAIHRILPYLHLGYRYDEVVFMANLKSVLPASMWNDEEKRNRVLNEIRDLIENYHFNPENKNATKEKIIRNYLIDDECIDPKYVDRLYHPSKIETYPSAQPNDEGIYQLGSPRTSSIRNPMAMRALFRLRILINHLLKEQKIDRQTKINIEFARGLNDANMRKAIQSYQKDLEKKRKEYADRIREDYKAETNLDVDPTEDDILKYQLWEEQNHICLYTGNSISVSQFIGSGNTYDIEHTIPRSKGGDNSQVNKTLCDNRFNRDVKKAKMPSELSNYAEIMARVEELGWGKQIQDLRKKIEFQIRLSKNASTKDDKDRAIQNKHKLKMQLNYLSGKLERFKMTKIPEGFSNRQGVDIGIIGKYARMYLRSVFTNVHTVKGATTAEFRKMWGLQNEYEKKARVNHAHHCIDAITIACIGQNEYDQWKRFATDTDRYEFGMQANKPTFEKPWPTFTEDVKNVAEELLVYYREPDKMKKQTKKLLRVRGKIQYGTDGQKLFIQGDSARGALHLQTYYGAIQTDDGLKYVIRKSLDQLSDKDVEKIVDAEARNKVSMAVKKYRSLKDAVAAGIWMNEEKRIPINKVRIFASSVAEPIHLKAQRDASSKEYKSEYYVQNDSNYCMAIYEGTDAKGKRKRTFSLMSLITAASLYKDSVTPKNTPLIRDSEINGFSLKCILKIGTLVLFYEKDPNELKDCSQIELVKRLYRVTGLSSLTVNNYHYGTIVLVHNQEARQSTEFKPSSGAWKMDDQYRPSIKIYHTQMFALVEGIDFSISVDGHVSFLK